MKEIQNIELSELSYAEYRINRGDINGLAKNIKTYGLQFPLIVVKSDEGKGNFDIIDGRRRYQALWLIAQEDIEETALCTAPCIVLTKEEAKEDLSLVLNTYRLDHNPLELYTMATRYVKDELGGDPLALPLERVKDVAAKLNLDIHATCRILNIGRMDEELRDAISSKKISLRLALLTLRISSKSERKKFWRRCVKDHPSMNEALNYMRWDFRGAPNRKLDTAVFDTLKDCVECRHRAYHDKSLFDGISRTDETAGKHFCWNISCYEKKEKTAWDEAFKEAKEKLGLIHISKIKGWLDGIPFKVKKVLDLEQCRKCKQVKLGVQYQHSDKLGIYCPKTCENIKRGKVAGQQERVTKKDPKDFTKKDKEIVLEGRFSLAARKTMIENFFVKDKKTLLEGKEPKDYKRILFFVGCDAHRNPFSFGARGYDPDYDYEKESKIENKIIADLDLEKVAEYNIEAAAEHLYFYDNARTKPEEIDEAIELLYGIKKWCKKHYAKIVEKLLTPL
ncbi:hypothetical protein ES703_113616 [subsurface metagenome]